MKSKATVPTVAVPYGVWQTWYKKNRAYADAEIQILTGRPGQRAHRRNGELDADSARSVSPQIG